MKIFSEVLGKLGIKVNFEPRRQLKIFLLDDDERRHEWFTKRFAADHLDIASTAERAIEMLSSNNYDVIFLDHDLLPEHYGSEILDDERTGYAVAAWLAANPDLQQFSFVTVHTRNADGAMRMVEELRRVGRQAEYTPFPMLAQKIKNYWRR